VNVGFGGITFNFPNAFTIKALKDLHTIVHNNRHRVANLPTSIVDD
jgi:hypothetical protein